MSCKGLASGSGLSCGLSAGLSVPGEEGEAQGEERERDADGDDACPAGELPAGAGGEGAEGAADEEGGHEDGVDAVGGFGVELHDAGLVAELDALDADVDDDDAGDHAGVGVAEDAHDEPGEQDEGVADVVEVSEADFADVLADGGGGECAGDAAQAEDADGVAVGMKGGLRHFEGEAGPDGEEGAEGKSGAQGADAQGRVLFDQGEDGAHEVAIAAGEVRADVGQDFEGDGGAQDHEDGGDEVHGAPAEPVADEAGDDARGEDAGEQAGHDDADVAAFVFGPRELRGDGDEDLRDDGAGAGDERGGPDDGQVRGDADGEQGKDQ